MPKNPQKKIAFLNDPSHFGYVPLRRKVLDNNDYTFTIPRERRKTVTWEDQQHNIRSDHQKQIIKDETVLDEGADLAGLPSPRLVLGLYDEDDDFLSEVKEIQGILHNPELSISQKYKSLGLNEKEVVGGKSDEDDDDAGSCSCWVKFWYKIGKMYGAQWPLVRKPNR